ncbi:hypothetical protein K388_06963 [Streptomyces sp. KhCrAH-43]|nr:MULTISPECIES: hypothetical protein [unclassified Streptomyces]RAJ48615.1 hypothetical protein K388_06963 [Streptomyces sp. KhCrAH-43]
MMCMTCKHPGGGHAVVVPREGWPARCDLCSRCEAEKRAKREEQEQGK